MKLTPKSLFWLAAAPLALYFTCSALDSWIERKSYMFTAEDIASAANEARLMGGTCEQMLENSAKVLQKRYPHLIDLNEDGWILMRAGGWIGQFRLLYASLTEYVLLFGTAIPTSGHSGRYWANITDTLLCGHFLQWNEGTVAPLEHGPGATVPHPKFVATGVAWTANTWMVEHAHGLIPTTMPFAFADGIISAQDFVSLWKALKIYGRYVVWNLVHGRI
jgi:hypothetical protein